MEYLSPGEANPGKDEEPAKIAQKRDRQLLCLSSKKGAKLALWWLETEKHFHDREGHRALGKAIEECGISLRNPGKHPSKGRIRASPTLREENGTKLGLRMQPDKEMLQN